MPFPFTFKLSVPEISNPFSAPPLNNAQGAHQAGRFNSGIDPAFKSNLNRDARNSGPSSFRETSGSPTNFRRRPSPLGSRQGSSAGGGYGASRKRGWEPSFAEPSQSIFTLASSNGYLDTPAKYREAAVAQKLDDYERIELPDDNQPPAKRRRGLAGSIVSTALSAALIGTAVGLTFYRLWRDRGKEPEQQTITVSSSPPPPYSSSDPQSSSSSSQAPPPALNVVPPTPRSRRARQSHPVQSSARRRSRRAHQTHSISSFGPANPNSASGSATPLFPPTQPAFDFSSSPRRIPVPPRTYSDMENEVEDDVDADDQMDWIGSKLSSLIEEGRKALGREVVVMSEAAEDEVDDGEGNWVEEDEGDDQRGRSRTGGSRSGSRRRRSTAAAATGSLGRRAGAGLGMTINPPSSYAPLLLSASSSSSNLSSASPRRNQFSVSSSLPASLPEMPHAKRVEESDGASWESPEMRELMEKARAKAKERRAQQGLTADYGATSFS